MGKPQPNLKPTKMVVFGRSVLTKSIFAPSVGRDKQVVRCFRRICFPDKLQYPRRGFRPQHQAILPLGPDFRSRGMPTRQPRMRRVRVSGDWPRNQADLRRRLPSREVIRLGRAPQNGWAVPWDMRISREHADLVLEGEGLRVRRLISARNAIYFHGEPAEEFTVGPGEDFRIGQTVFRLDTVSPEQADVPRRPSLPVADPPISWSDFPAGSDRRVCSRSWLNSIRTRLVWNRRKTRRHRLGSKRSSQRATWTAMRWACTNSPINCIAARRAKYSRLGMFTWTAGPPFNSGLVQLVGRSLGSVPGKAVLIAGFDQENIIRVYEGGRIGDLHYLIMEYVEGCTLAKRLLRHRLDVATAVGYVIQAARALAMPTSVKLCIAT